MLKATAGPPIAPVMGAILEGSRLHCLVRAASEDEREQLADLVDQSLLCGQNAAGVPYELMLQNRGLTLLEPEPDRPSEQRQAAPDGDPAHGPVVYQNDLVYPVRSQITYVPTPQGVTLITTKQTLQAPSFTARTVGTAP